MQRLYRKLDIPNLEILQKQVMLLFPNHLYRYPRIFFPENQSEFFKIPELTDLLDMYHLSHNDTWFGFNAMGPYIESPIHIDWGHNEYSINIPLLNCNQTTTYFYKNLSEPTINPERIINGIKYRPNYSFKNVVCEKIDQFESNIPCIMSIKTPHNVESNQPKFRVNLLIRNNNNVTTSNILNFGTPDRIRTGT